MPKDSAGNFHLSSQRASASDRMGPKAAPPMEGKEPKEAPAGEGENSTTLHDHGDGTFHTEAKGEKTEHPHIGHALMHMAGKHSTGKHFHAHHDGASIKSHSSDHGMTEGPNEHGSADEAADSMRASMGDGAQGEGEMAMPEDESAHSVPSFSGM